jgi:TRAP transporter TAXI family solute receptor
MTTSILRRNALALAGVAVLATAVAWPWQARAESLPTVRLMMSPSGSGPYNAFATIQTHMAEFSDKLKISVEETPGFNFNVKYLAQHPERFGDTVFGSGTVLNWAAKTGQAPFYPKPLKAAADFRVIAVLGLSYNVWVTTDKSIRTPKDFVGKRVGIGLLTQNEWGMHQRMLLDAWGLTPRLASLDTLGTAPNINAMLDGRTDVGTLFGLTSSDGQNTVVTGPHRQLEASKRDWHYVEVPAKMVQDYTGKTGAPFRVVKYDANVLPNQPKPLTAFGDLLLLQAHKSFPEAAAYELVRVLVDHYDKISKYSAFTRVWTGKTLAHTADTQPELFHPGSLRAFRDLGLIP